MSENEPATSAEDTPEPQAQGAQQVASEAERARRRNLIAAVFLLAVSIAVVTVVQWDRISEFFKGAPEKVDPLADVRADDGSIRPPSWIEISQGGEVITLVAEPNFWALKSHQNARVRPGAVVPLVAALDVAAGEYAQDGESISDPQWQSYALMEFKWESGTSHHVLVKGSEVYFPKARKAVNVPGLSLPSDHRHWLRLHINALTDLDPDPAKQMRLVELATIHAQHPDGNWALAQHSKSGRWVMIAPKRAEVRQRYIKNALHSLQNLNILDVWNKPEPALFGIEIDGGPKGKRRIWISRPAAHERFAALRVDADGALYKVSKVLAELLLPSAEKLEDRPIVPPAEGSDQEIVGYKASDTEIILISDQQTHMGLSPPLGLPTPQEALQLAKEIHHALAQATLPDQEFQKQERHSSWRDKAGKVLTRFERFPVHESEVSEVLAAVKDLQPGQVASRVFSTPFGLIVLYRPQN